MAKVKDMFDELKDFELLLDVAESNAETSWEMEFVEALADRYADYLGETFLSEKHEEVLRRIADGG